MDAPIVLHEIRETVEITWRQISRVWRVWYMGSLEYGERGMGSNLNLAKVSAIALELDK